MKNYDVVRFLDNYKKLCSIGLGRRLQEPIAFIPFRRSDDGSEIEEQLGVFKHAECTRSLVEFADKLRGSIYDSVSSGGSVSEAFRIRIVVLKDLFKTVQLLHSNNCFHRGLGPRSILIDCENKILLKYFDESGSCKYGTDRGAIMPSRSDSYHSPMAADSEINDFFIPLQVRKWPEGIIDPRLPDQYACGALVYYILSGAEVTSANSKLLDYLPGVYSLTSTGPDTLTCIDVSEKKMLMLKSALARDLVLRLIRCSPDKFSMPHARSHPLFWEPANRMEFLREVSTFTPYSKAKCQL